MGMPIGRFGVLKVFGLILNGTKITASSSDINNLTAAPALTPTPGLYVVGGQATTTSATDGVVTGLGVITGVTVSLETDPTPLAQHFTAVVAGQTAGTFLLKGWKAASSVLTSEIAASSFGKIVNWTAVGTS